MAWTAVFVLTCKGMIQGHLRTSQEGGSDLAPKDMLFPLSYPHPPCRISPKSCLLQEAFPECKKPACVFFSPTSGPQDSPYFLACSQLGVVESALALESEDLDLRPNLTSKETWRHNTLTK